MPDLTKWSIDKLKNAIWMHNNGRVPTGGLDIEEYRNELIRRGEDGRGYHEEAPELDDQEQPIKTLEDICKPVVDYLKNNYNPHCTVIITNNQIKLVEDKISVPVRSDD